MPKILLAKDEFLKAIALLRKRKLYRAANRLEALSQDILNPQPKVKKPKATKVQLVGGSGRKFPSKLYLEDELT